MLYSEYVASVARTMPMPDGVDRERIFNLGLFGEAGEVVDLIKKIEGHGHPLSQHLPKLKEEMGDLLFYSVGLGILWGNEASFAGFYATDWTEDRKDLESTSLLDFAEHLMLVWMQPARVILCIGMISAKLGFSIEDCAKLNSAKRAHRYPKGFSEAASLARKQ